jgi:hypothetical protein
MSVEMKRKASTLKLSNQKNPLSIGFSLNNPRRVDAHTGQPQTQTLFRGTGARGVGIPGTQVINKSQYICADLFDVPHPSVKNTRGYLSTKNKWLNRTYPYSVVKNTSPPSYDIYLHKIKGELAKKSEIVDSGTCVCPQTTKSNVGNYHKDILKMNYTIYYQSNIFKKECIPLPPSKAHYPPQNVGPVSFCTPAFSLQEFMDKQNNFENC